MVAATENTPRVRSGRYQFRFWHTDGQGQRFALRYAPPNWAGAYPDLISTAYRNREGAETVYGIAFDLDAHRAQPKWLDAAGRLDWPKISAYLAEAHGKVFSQISHVVRSTGGKGLAVVVAINPLPIKPTTEKNQRTALNLQSRLVGLFNRIGLGADPGARGIVRDFPNFQNPERCLLDNRLALRRAEQGREPLLRYLHAYLNELEAGERREQRIYNDARAETGLARLVVWLLGASDGKEGLRQASFLSGETLWASTAELASLTGLSSKFLRCFLKTPPDWLRVEYVEDGWRLSIPLGRAVQRLLPRAEALLIAQGGWGGGRGKKFLFSVAAIKEPEFVEDGERNSWLTSLALAYKWHGYGREESQAKIELRLLALPGSEFSRNCRQVRSIVKAVYRNLPHMAGRFADRDLPEWMVDDAVFGKKLTLRRGFTPGVAGVGGQREVPREATLPKLEVEPSLLSFQDETCQVLSAGGEGAGSFSFRAASDSQQRGVSIAAIGWRQRVGLFDGLRLVLCVTRRHYRAHAALALLACRPDYEGTRLTIYTPHKDRQAVYRAAIESCDDVLQSALVFGARKTYAEKLSVWRAEKERGEVSTLAGLFEYGIDSVENLSPYTKIGWDLDLAQPAFGRD